MQGCGGASTQEITKRMESKGEEGRTEMPAATVLLCSLQRVGQVKLMQLLLGFYLCTTK